MPNYIRLKQEGGYYFFTVVTNRRRPFLTDELARDCLRNAIGKARQKRPFELFATALLPDHWHCIWILPPGDSDFPQRWNRIKRRFTIDYLAGGGTETPVSISKVLKRERGIWQRRYWEHRIDSEAELRELTDYIHWNPVKHGYVARPADWRWSSFHRFVESGDYPPDWGIPSDQKWSSDIYGGDGFE